MYKPGVIRRRITGLGLAALFVLMWLLQGWVARIGLGLLGILGVWEVYAVLEHGGSKPIRWVGMGYMALCVPVCHFCGRLSGLFVLSVLAVAIGLSAVMLKADVESDAPLATLFPIFYPGMLFGILLIFTYIESRMCATVVMGVLYLSAIINDIAAYEIGSVYGKRPLAPKLSPKKTVEGSIAGVISSTALSIFLPVVAGLLCKVVPAWKGLEADIPSLWIFAVFGVVAGVVAQFGDLCASMIKRHCGVKDYGTIFPGHGGVMDRLDSILFNGLCAVLLFGFVMK